MRKVLLCVWLLMPVGAAAYHLGPGQDQLLIDDVARLVGEARDHAERATALGREGDELAAASAWAEAETCLEQALGAMPADAEDLVVDRQRLRLERAKCQMFISELPKANADLGTLVTELAEVVKNGECDPELLSDARRTHANSQYYMTWLMRLEGLGRDEWEPRIESARQTYKLLVEEARADDLSGQDIAAVQEDLEAAIRLARMDLTELQGLPLPSQ